MSKIPKKNPHAQTNARKNKLIKLYKEAGLTPPESLYSANIIEPFSGETNTQ